MLGRSLGIAGLGHPLLCRFKVGGGGVASSGAEQLLGELGVVCHSGKPYSGGVTRMRMGPSGTGVGDGDKSNRMCPPPVKST